MQPPFRVEDLVNLLYLVYRTMRDAIQFLLESTLIKANPTLAAKYADAITLLTTVTAILLVFEFVASAKKVVAIIVALGWIFLIASVLIGPQI